MENETLERLKANTVIDLTANCWLWQGATNNKGYGHIRFRSYVVQVHRLSAHLHLGLDLNDSQIPVLHKIECLHVNCWNPEHLYLGSNSENVQDSVLIGSYRNPIAEVNKAKTHCKHGHELSGDNLYIPKDGRRRCNICRRRNSSKTAISYTMTKI